MHQSNPARCPTGLRNVFYLRPQYDPIRRNDRQVIGLPVRPAPIQSVPIFSMRFLIDRLHTLGRPAFRPDNLPAMCVCPYPALVITSKSPPGFDHFHTRYMVTFAKLNRGDCRLRFGPSAAPRFPKNAAPGPVLSPGSLHPCRSSVAPTPVHPLHPG